jgi:hypothetical protein
MKRLLAFYPAQKFSMPIYASKPCSCNEFRDAQYSFELLSNAVTQDRADAVEGWTTRLKVRTERIRNKGRTPNCVWHAA